MDGCCYNSSIHLTTDPTNSKFNNSGSNYVDQGQAYEVSHMTKIIGTSGAGFISGSSTSGSDTTYYADSCDMTFIDMGGCLYVGGSYGDTAIAGIFHSDCSSATSSNNALGCRICYL